MYGIAKLPCPPCRASPRPPGARMRRAVIGRNDPIGETGGLQTRAARVYSPSTRVRRVGGKRDARVDGGAAIADLNPDPARGALSRRCRGSLAPRRPLAAPLHLPRGRAPLAAS